MENDSNPKFTQKVLSVKETAKTKKKCSKNVQLKETHFQGSGPGLLSALVESLRFVALPPVAAHISHNIATRGEVWETNRQCLLKHRKRPNSFFFNTDTNTYTNTETAVGEKGVDTTGKFPPVSRARFPTGDCPFTYFGSGANRGPSCANTRGNTSRLQLTQIPNAQSCCKMYTLCVYFPRFRFDVQIVFQFKTEEMM